MTTELPDPLFTITLHRDGAIEVSGGPKNDKLPEILRIIADALEAGQVRLRIE